MFSLSALWHLYFSLFNLDYLLHKIARGIDFSLEWRITLSAAILIIS